MDYDYGNKRQFRRELYAFADRNLDRVPRAQRRVVYLDTAPALETEFLLNKGYSPRNLFPVNWSAAHIAHINRRFPDVHGFGRDIIIALEELKKAGMSPHITSLDSCQPLGDQLVETVGRIAEMSIPGAVFVVNVLDGREHGFAKQIRAQAQVSHWPQPGEFATIDEELDFIDGVQISILDSRKAKYKIIENAIMGDGNEDCRRHIKNRIVGRYRSTAGHQNMIYFCCSLLPCKHDFPPLCQFAKEVVELNAPACEAISDAAVNKIQAIKRTPAGRELEENLRFLSTKFNYFMSITSKKFEKFEKSHRRCARSSQWFAETFFDGQFSTPDKSVGLDFWTEEFEPLSFDQLSHRRIVDEFIKNKIELGRSMTEIQRTLYGQIQ